MKCSVDGCDDPQRGKSHGLCNRHRIRYRETGTTAAGPRSRSIYRAADAYAAALKAAGEDGPCMEWPGGRNAKGYGVYRRNGQNLATRSLWVEVHGPIPDGFCVCHRCDNPPCVRLSHLFLGTKAANSADMASKGRSARNAGERSGRCKFTDAEVAAIRLKRTRGATCEQLAAEYNASPSYISRLTTGQRRTDNPKQATADGWMRGRRAP